MTIIPAKELHDLLECDFTTGQLFWKPRLKSMFASSKSYPSWNTKYAGKEALNSFVTKGYKSGFIFKNRYAAHRVIWAMHTGEWPKGQIDHINGDTSDNRIENLRDVSAIENHRNRRLNSNNKSGVPGVVWNNREQKWRAQIWVSRKQIYLGSFESKDDAVAVRIVAASKLGFHENHGRTA